MGNINLENAHPQPKINKSHGIGVKGHLVAFALSIVLTALAFIGVIYFGDDRSFVIPYIIGLGIVQALAQLFIWMHMSEKGHLFPLVGMVSGVVVILPVILMGLYLCWW
ncbi:cytochrome C oxidase subunit IV family protein [Brevibacillus dissolubilis]|uniref:cytochrome C oxidase subunit IV family protein n=1 Tax=Brevibacillus dissolubilis TaxID=1844116 RepID=UPI0011172910|nr:cytochrome C oxidase subunit IV family protein [Brevibacillus dissolubilis]